MPTAVFVSLDMSERETAATDKQKEEETALGQGHNHM